MGWVGLWVLSACSGGAPAPERSFEALAEEDWGPCSCPGSEPAKSIWLTLRDGKKAPATFTGLTKDCKVEVTAHYSAGGGQLPSESRTTAWGIGADPNAFRCPDPWGKVRFHQDKESCKTVFHNISGTGPAQYRVLTTESQGHSVALADGDSRLMDCGMDLRLFAPDWQMVSADSKLVDGVRQVNLTWHEAPTLNLHLMDREGNDLAWHLLLGVFGAVGTDATGRVSFGASRGIVALTGFSLPMQPAIVTHMGGERELEIEMDIAPPLRVVFADRARMPVCKDGPGLSCREDQVTGQALCYCEPEDDGSTVLIWSGGEVRVPEGVRTIRLDTRQYTGEVIGQLNGGSTFALRLVSLDAPDPGTISLHPERPSKTEGQGFRFPMVAPGRYAVEEGVWPLNIRLSEVIVVGDAPVDIGTLVIED